MIKETEVPPTARQSFKALDASTVPQVTENQQSPPALGQGLVRFGSWLEGNLQQIREGMSPGREEMSPGREGRSLGREVPWEAAPGTG